MFVASAILIQLFGVGLIAWGVRLHRLTVRARSWPSVMGTITVSEMRDRWTKDRDGDRMPEYFAEIRYTYSVGGRSYNGDRIAIGGIPADRNSFAVHDVVRRFPPSAKVKVFYDPGAPEFSLLQHQSPNLVNSLAIGAAAVVMGTILLYIRFR